MILWPQINEFVGNTGLTKENVKQGDINNINVRLREHAKHESH